MKAIIWKEWREQLLCALSATIAVSLICAWMLHQAMTANQSWETVWTQGVMMPFTGLAPLVAAVLGTLQIMPELKRDQWAFLIHRPVSHGTIFWGKVVAGLSLYLLPTILPLLGLFLWLSIPGHTPGPFIGQIFLAPIADIFGGVIFYFAALLATLRLSKSRLSYFRILAFAVGLVCAAFSALMAEFWQSLAVSALGIFIVGNGAWGSFVSLDSYEKQPVSSRAGLITSLYVGVAATTIAGVAFVLTLVPTAPSNYWYTEYRVSKSSGIIKLTQSRSGATATDLQGKTLKSKDSNGVWSDLINETTLHLKAGTPYQESYRSSRRYALPISQIYQASNNENWFYLRGHRWFEVYNEENHQREGFLGPQGFSRLPPQQRFTDDLQDYFLYSGNQIFQFSDAVYWIDLPARRISLLHQSPAGEKTFTAQDVSVNSYLGNNTSWGAVIVANQQIRFFSNKGQLRFVLPLQFAPADYPSLSIAPVSDSKLIVRQIGYKEIEGKTIELPMQVREVSGTGQIIKQYQVPPITNSSSYKSPSPYPCAVLVPPGAMALMATYGAVGTVIGNEQATYLWKSLKENPAQLWIFTLITMVVGLICAFFAWRFGSQHQVSSKTRWTWAIAVFFSGFFGLLTLFILREWPARIACENCGKGRSVAQETCAHCRDVWAPPALDGTEIFA